LKEIEDFPREKAPKMQDIEEYRDMQELCLRNLEFNYGRESVLKNANATVKKGEIVCLTGMSGSGKSTIFKLLLNVYQPLSGEIVLRGGIENCEKKLTAKHRGLFAYVPQGEFLFSGTIYENLTFFTSGEKADLEERVKRAISVACAEFVWDLPQGLQTPLKEGGAGLSEGQMQRLAVARAILSDRQVLLLDEATSALDGETEQRLLENIRSLKEKTCLIVTHRPAALSIADRILSLEQGTLKEMIQNKNEL
jgi:ATP-binding cassette subfamily B protein